MMVFKLKVKIIKKHHDCSVYIKLFIMGVDCYTCQQKIQPTTSKTCFQEKPQNVGNLTKKGDKT